MAVELVGMLRQRFGHAVMAHGEFLGPLRAWLGHNSPVRLCGSSAALERWRPALKPERTHGALVKEGATAVTISIARR